MSALLVEKNGPVVTLTINRAESRNPLGEEGDGDLFAQACQAINTDREVRCAILTGAGTAFSAGGNVKEVLDALGQKHPNIVGRIFENGQVRRFVNIYLNDEDVRFLDNLQTATKDGDVLAIIPAVAGG